MKRIVLVLASILAITFDTERATAQSPPAAFKVERTGAVPSGRSMILIPGFLSSGEVWKGTVERFKRDYDMHVLTLAGFAGVPAADSGAFLSTTRDAIVRYIREQRLDHPVIVGHSLGGFISLWIAVTRPDLIGPVVAVDGVPFLSALGDTTMTAAKASAQATMIRTSFAGMSREVLGAQTRMAMMQQTRDTTWYAVGTRWGSAADSRVAGQAIAEMMTTDIRGEVGAIKVPVLLMMAGNGMNAEQQAIALSRYRGQLATVRNARVVPFADARHFIMLDEPALFHETIADFLSGR